MKIGVFASNNNLSIDAIRHYMDMGLILPEKRASQYNFDELCQKDLDNILNFKKMGFTLNEIKSIFMLKRLGNLTAYEANEYYKEFFKSKYSELGNQIIQLDNMKTEIEKKLNEISNIDTHPNIKIGFDLRGLSLLTCLKCGGELKIHEGNITNNQIINGTLKCSCGEKYKIEDGILIINMKNDTQEVKYDEDFIVNYINFTDVEYLETVCRGVQWAHKQLNSIDLENKVLLELGSGSGFLLRDVYTDLPTDTLYFAVDHSICRHKFLKNILEMSEYKKNIIFICSDFLQVPIKKESIDILLDFSGTSNYSFEHEEFLLDLIDLHVKNNAYLLGSYILFKNFNLYNSIEIELRKNFILDKVKANIHKLKYESIEENISSYIDRGGKYEDYFHEGEKVYMYSFYGKRLG